MQYLLPETAHKLHHAGCKQVAVFLPRIKLLCNRFVLESMVINLALLGFFKYADFLIGNVNALFGSEIAFLKILGAAKYIRSTAGKKRIKNIELLNTIY